MRTFPFEGTKEDKENTFPKKRKLSFKCSLKIENPLSKELFYVSNFPPTTQYLLDNLVQRIWEIFFVGGKIFIYRRILSYNSLKLMFPSFEHTPVLV